MRGSSKVSNQEARDLLAQNRAEFIARVKECVTTSKERIYDEPPTDDPHYITFEKFDKDLHGPIVERIKQGKDMSGTPTTTASNGLSWVKEGEFKPLSIE